MEKIMIAAWDAETLGIGRNNKLPWPNLQADMIRFKNETMGFPCIMGSETFWSIPAPYRPLSGRLNIVVTRNLDGKHYPDDVKVVSSIDEAIAVALETGKEKLFFTGGSGIYKEVMKRSLANKILGTSIFPPEKITGLDTFFPKMGKEWNCTSISKLMVDASSNYGIQFTTMINSKNPLLEL